MKYHFPRVRNHKESSISGATNHCQPVAALAAATIAGLGSLGASLPAQAALVANYEFRNTLSSTIPTAPDLVPFGPGSYTTATIGGTPTTIYNFGVQQGLSLNTAGMISDNYTIAIVFSFDGVSGWRKIFDFKNLTNDDGLYTSDGRLRFWPIDDVGPALGPATFFETVLTRASSTNLISVYMEGTPIFSFTDSYFSGVISAANLLNIFQDDIVFAGAESSSGSVAAIRIFNHVLTAAEVANLHLISPSAAPPKGVPAPLPLLGFAAACGWSRNLRRRLRR